jgi:uncharacterized protein YceK
MKTQARLFIARMVLLPAVAFVGGCATVNSTTFTQGAIQSGRKSAAVAQDGEGRKGTLGVVQVLPFTESRVGNQQERHNLWRAYIPIGVWDVIGNVRIGPLDTNRSAYKPSASIWPRHYAWN